MTEKLRLALEKVKNKPIVILTGAGMSAESGIPTFRGKGGFWTVGSTNYSPQEIATRRAFSQIPDEVWLWHLCLRTVCNEAQPNPAHHIVSELERALQNRFLLVTMNIDGLHLRAGNTLERTLQVHGAINFMRCAEECHRALHKIPDDMGRFVRGDRLKEHHRALLVCPECQGPARPHVLWFDEFYDEDRFRYQSARQASFQCGALVSIGCSGSTTIPNLMVGGAQSQGALLIDINPERGPFAATAEQSGGFWLKSSASEGMALIAQALGLPAEGR